jgi:hypothetical protein
MTSKLVAPPDVYDREERPIVRSSSFREQREAHPNWPDLDAQDLENRVRNREIRRTKFNNNGNSEEERAKSLLRGIKFEDKWACNFWKTITETKKIKYINDSKYDVGELANMNVLAANASLNVAKAINEMAAEKVENLNMRLQQATKANEEDYIMAELARARDEANAAACEVAADEAVLKAAKAAEAAEAADPAAAARSATDDAVLVAAPATGRPTDFSMEAVDRAAIRDDLTKRQLTGRGGRRRTRSIFTYFKRRKNRYNTYRKKKRKTTKRRKH